MQATHDAMFQAATEKISDCLAVLEDICFATLIGSRCNHTARADSDWDIAVWIARNINGLHRLDLLEEARHKIASALSISPDKVDIIDLAESGLAMRATVANGGLLVKQDPGSLYNRFLVRTWRELEEFDRENRHAA